MAHLFRVLLAGAVIAGVSWPAAAEPRQYQIDPAHTFPTFEVSHLGFSQHRGRFNRTSGTLTLDRSAGTGELDVSIDAASIDTGHEALEKVLRSDGFFDVEQHPALRYRSKGFVFDGDRVRAVDGELTLLGATRPVRLELDHFHCAFNPLLQREVCGANAVGRLRRAEFGMGKFITFGLGDEVRISIQVEALGERPEAPVN